MQKKIIVLALISAFAAPAAFADTEKAELEKLRAMVQELDQKIRALEHKLESKTAAPAQANASAEQLPARARGQRTGQPEYLFRRDFLWPDRFVL